MNPATKIGIVTPAVVVTAISLAIAATALVNLACGPGPPDPSRTYDARKLARVLERDWDENPVRFQARVAGTRMSAHGRIDWIGRDGRVVFRMGSVVRTRLECRFGNQRDLIRLSSGDKIDFSGRVDDVRYNSAVQVTSVSMQDCRLTSGPQ